jgi:hypothetical protein
MKKPLGLALVGLAVFISLIIWRRHERLETLPLSVFTPLPAASSSLPVLVTAADLASSSASITATSSQTKTSTSSADVLETEE